MYDAGNPQPFGQCDGVVRRAVIHQQKLIDQASRYIPERLLKGAFRVERWQNGDEALIADHGTDLI
jgi:hypothetical protein